MENEVAQSLPSPDPPQFTLSLPSKPFPFLNLPREIRDIIYHYALLRPQTGPSVTPTHICYFHTKPPAWSASKSYWTCYWGTEKSTRLFLVNHQISHEALELFYSTYPFHFPQTFDVASVNATLRDTLSPWARNLIGSIGFMFGLQCTPNRFTLLDEEDERQAIEAVMKLLPNIKRVELTLTFMGFEVPDYQVKEIVARALKIASPLRDVGGLVLIGADDENAQRTYIMRELRDVLGCK